MSFNLLHLFAKKWAIRRELPTPTGLLHLLIFIRNFASIRCIFLYKKYFPAKAL